MNIVQQFIIWALPVLFAITVHEVAHGWVASKLGDPTALMLGRLTLNPIKHIDPIGTILVPAVLLYLGGFIFGWAKPVPVTWRNLKHPKRDMVLVTIAGPLANLLMAIFWGMAAKLGYMWVSEIPRFAMPLIYMGKAGIIINTLLMVLNLIPIPPLDGSKVLMGLLPNRYSYYIALLEPYGFFILLALIFTGVLFKIMGPGVYFVQKFIAGLWGL